SSWCSSASSMASFSSLYRTDRTDMPRRFAAAVRFHILLSRVAKISWRSMSSKKSAGGCSGGRNGRVGCIKAGVWLLSPKCSGEISLPLHRVRAKRRSEEHTSELQSRFDLVCRLLLDKKKSEIERG